MAGEMLDEVGGKDTRLTLLNVDSICREVKHRFHWRKIVPSAVRPGSVHGTVAQSVNAPRRKRILNQGF